MEKINKDSSCDNTFECEVARYMNWFIRFLHVLFCLALVITVVLTLVVFASDIYNVFTTGNIATGTIHALGGLLVLWTLSELLHSEVRHLLGERIQVTIFIEVAIAAFVRKLLVVSTEGVSLESASTYLVSLLVLGIVYWFFNNKQRTRQ